MQIDLVVNMKTAKALGINVRRDNGAHGENRSVAGQATALVCVVLINGSNLKSWATTRFGGVRAISCRSIRFLVSICANLLAGCSAGYAGDPVGNRTPFLRS